MKVSIKLPVALNETGNAVANEDFVYPIAGNADFLQKLFIVCDGRGNSGNGIVAAKLVAEYFNEYISTVNPPRERRVAQLYLNEALRYAERHLQEYTITNPEARSSTTSIAMLYLNEDNTITVAWVGNTRVYHLRGQKILFKTEDHLENTWNQGKRVVVPRTISGTKPVWLSSAVITDIEPNDYFLLNTEGVTQTLEERNLKYLLSQGDGTDTTNLAIVDKIKELCNESSQSNFSMYLIQIEGTENALAPYTNAPETNQSPKVAQDISAGDLTIKTKRTFPSAKDITFQKDNKYVRRALWTIFGILVLAASAFAYKYSLSNPEDVFNKHFEQGKFFMKSGDYSDAIKEWESALAVNWEDSVERAEVSDLLANAQEALTIEQANQFYQSGNLLKAKYAFQHAAIKYPENEVISEQLERIGHAICTEKEKLMMDAERLMLQEQYADAKQSLYSALYLDRADAHVVTLLNACNFYLQTDSLTFTHAVQTAITYIENPEAFKQQEEAQAISNTEIAASEIEDPKPTKPKPTPKPIYKPVKEPMLDANTKVDEGIDDEAAVQAELDELLKEADAAFTKGKFSDAKGLYEQALSYDQNEVVMAKIAKCDENLNKKSEYANMIRLGDKAFNEKNYAQALNYYKGALEHKEEDSYANKMIKQSQGYVSQYDNLIGSAEKAYNFGNYQTARQQYEQALQFAPDKTAIQAKIAECDRKIAAAQNTGSKKDVKKAEKFCKSNNYNSMCYTYLKNSGLFYSIPPSTLYALGKNFESGGEKDMTKAKECYGTAAAKGYSPAVDKVKQLK